MTGFILDIINLLKIKNQILVKVTSIFCYYNNSKELTKEFEMATADWKSVDIPPDEYGYYLVKVV